MADSAFRSTSKRGAFAGSSASNGKDYRQEDPRRRQQGRRSKSVNPLTKQMVEEPTFSSSFLKRDNPLFSSPSLPPTDLGRFIEPSKSDSRGSDGRRGRSISRGPGWSGWRSDSSSTRQGIGRSLSRVDTSRKRRSVSRGPCGMNQSETEKEQVCSLASAMRNKLTTAPDKSRHTRNSRSESAWCRASNVLCSDDEAFENENHTGFFSETEKRPLRSVSKQLKIPAKSLFAIQRMNQSYMSDADISDPPPESLNPDAVELTCDIRREYTLQLEQSEERLRKLQADLDAEEQRRQELSRMLFDVIPDPKASDTHRLKHKANIDHREMSRRLTEEAFSYFDECVSISTFDGSDFSSFDDPVSSSSHTQVRNHPVHGVSRASDIQIPITSSDRHEGYHGQSQCSLSSGDSDLVTATSINSISYPSQIFGSALSPRTDRYQFSLVGEEIQQLIKKSERGKSECGERVGRSGVNCDSFDCFNMPMVAEMILYDRVALQREIDFGGLLLCEFNVI